MNNVNVIENAVKYIEENLMEDIGLKDVADNAGYSYYHMTRLFKSVVGESVGNYIIMRRLALSAKELLHTNKKILDIAIEYGYESAEAFSRAFKHIYKVSPLEYRKNNIDYYIGSQQKISKEMFNNLPHITILPEIVELNMIKVAGIRGNTYLNKSEIVQLWNQYESIRSKILHVTKERRDFCICESDKAVYNKEGDVLYTEVIGTEVENFDDITEPIITKIIEPGKYAVFTHKGSLTGLYETYSYIWGVWAVQTKEKLDKREDFELYTKKFKGYNSEDTIVKIFIPIK